MLIARFSDSPLENTFLQIGVRRYDQQEQATIPKV